MHRSRLAFWIFFAPVIMWLLLLIVLPHLDLLTMSFRGEDDYGDMVWTFQNYMNFFTEPVYWLTFVRTALYAVITTFITFLLAMPVSFYIAKLARTRPAGRTSHPAPAPLLGQRIGAHLRLDDPAARIRRTQLLHAQARHHR